VDASILKRELEHGVEFLIVTRWESLEAIRAFAGPDAETAVVPENVQTMMLEYDRRVRHYWVVE
jgi:heme-degrading monooxygenase HmoA